MRGTVDGAAVGQQAPRGAGGGQPGHHGVAGQGKTALPQCRTDQCHRRPLDQPIRPCAGADTRRSENRIGDRTDDQQHRIRLYDLHPDHARKAVAGHHRPGFLAPLYGPRDGLGLREGLYLRLGRPRPSRIEHPEQVILESDPYRRLAFTFHTFVPELTELGLDEDDHRQGRSRAPLEGVFRHRTGRRRPGEADRRS